MKLAFSSLGMPGARIDELIRAAEAGKAEGLELRLAEGEAVSNDMPAAALETVRRRIDDAGLELIALSSYIKVCSPEPDADVIPALHRALEIAATLGAGGVRVFPGAPGPTTATAPGNGASNRWDENAAARLSAVAEAASSLGVQLLLETHDSHPTGRDVARILRLVEPSGTTKAIWDVLHPWRHGERPEDTANSLGGFLAYCQFKDATVGADPGAVTLTLPGRGAIPIAEISVIAEKVIRGEGSETYWACLEWEKAWHPGLEDLPAALSALRAILMPVK